MTENDAGTRLQPGSADGSGFDPSAPNGVGRLPVTVGVVGGQSVRVVDAHVLKAFLGSDIDFQAWFMMAVHRAGLQRGLDYERSGPPKVDPRTGRFGGCEVFSVEAAKKVAMMAGGLRGNAVREYFVEQARRMAARELLLPPLAELRH